LTASPERRDSIDKGRSDGLSPAEGHRGVIYGCLGCLYRASFGVVVDKGSVREGGEMRKLVQVWKEKFRRPGDPGDRSILAQLRSFFIASLFAGGPSRFALETWQCRRRDRSCS
jgi:hypothetical protein